MGKSHSLVCAVGLLSATACGPVQSTTVIWEASTAIEGAHAADAQKVAPYEMVSAELYLEKALEEQSYADFEPAIIFGTKALEQARKARSKADAAISGAPIPTAPPAGEDFSGSPEPEAGAGPAPVRIVPVPQANETTPPSVVVPVQE